MTPDALHTLLPRGHVQRGSNLCPASASPVQLFQTRVQPHWDARLLSSVAAPPSTSQDPNPWGHRPPTTSPTGPSHFTFPTVHFSPSLPPPVGAPAHLLRPRHCGGGRCRGGRCRGGRLRPQRQCSSALPHPAAGGRKRASLAHTSGMHPPGSAQDGTLCARLWGTHACLRLLPGPLLGLPSSPHGHSSLSEPTPCAARLPSLRAL